MGCDLYFLPNLSSYFSLLLFSLIPFFLYSLFLSLNSATRTGDCCKLFQSSPLVQYRTYFEAVTVHFRYVHVAAIATLLFSLHV